MHLNYGALKFFPQYGQIVASSGIALSQLGHFLWALWVGASVGKSSGNEKYAIISMILEINIIINPTPIMAVSAPMRYTVPVVLNKFTFVCSAIAL